jgi:hypothetical protein
MYCRDCHIAGSESLPPERCIAPFVNTAVADPLVMVTMGDARPVDATPLANTVTGLLVFVRPTASVGSA